MRKYFISRLQFSYHNVIKYFQIVLSYSTMSVVLQYGVKSDKYVYLLQYKFAYFDNNNWKWNLTPTPVYT